MYKTKHREGKRHTARVKKSTILPLAEEGWSSLHSVIKENEFWEVIDALKNAGAEGIIVTPIDKMVI